MIPGMKVLGDSNNPAIVLIHPFPFDARLWFDVANELADSYFVITPDLRGCGFTPLGDGEPSLDLLAEDIYELVTQAGLAKAVIGGISLGGYVALALAKKHPEIISGLILVDTKASADTDAAKENRLRIATQMRESGKVELFADQMITNVVGDFTHANRPDVVLEVRDWMREAKAESIAWLQEAMAKRADSFQTLERLSVPTLLIRGTQDSISTAEDFSLMEKKLRQVTYVQIPNSGHLPPIEDPIATTIAIENWLATFANR